jgi:exopolyphosphatase/guanosine-5'-triphosphate,3'-diphosphate pyrophosphatase
VLSGQEEAEMIFRGVCTDKELRSRRLWVVDVGGGSVEFILGANGIIEKKISLELGSVRIMSMFCPQLHANAETPVRMRSYLNEKFGEALTGWETADALAVATGGSALCIARWEGKEDNRTLTLRLLKSVIEEVWQMNLETLNSDHRIPKGRGEVLLAGAATYASALECVKKDEFTVSKRNLRYGLIDAVSKGYFSA